jgi:hypothetical protein
MMINVNVFNVIKAELDETLRFRIEYRKQTSVKQQTTQASSPWDFVCCDAAVVAFW